MATDPDPTGATRDDPNPPRIREQLAALLTAVRRLIVAHVELAKAELGTIMGEVGRVALLAGLAFSMLFLAALLIPIGLLLFLGDWLLGSMGWGIFLGSLLLIDIAVAAGLLAAGISEGRLARWFGVALLLGAAIGVVLALDLTNRAWTVAGDAVLTGTESGVRPLAMAVLTLGILGGIVGLIVGFQSRSPGGGFTSGAVAGTLLGALTAIAMGPRVGVAFGILAALIAWPALAGFNVSRTGIDASAFKARFYPGQTIETTKETIEWVRQRTPLGRKS